MNGLLNASTDTMSAFLSPKLPTENGDASASQTSPELLTDSEAGDLGNPKLATPKDAFANLLDGFTPSKLEKVQILPNQEAITQPLLLIETNTQHLPRAFSDQALIIPPPEKNHLVYAEVPPTNLLETSPQHDTISITKIDTSPEIAIGIQSANEDSSAPQIPTAELIAPNAKETALPVFIQGNIKASFIDAGIQTKLDAEYEKEANQSFITNRRASGSLSTINDIPALPQADTRAPLLPANNIELAQQDIIRQASYITGPQDIGLSASINTKQSFLNHDGITTSEVLIKAPVEQRQIGGGISPTNIVANQEVVRAGIKPTGDANTQDVTRAGIKPEADISAQEIIRAGIKPAVDVNTQEAVRAGIKPENTQTLANNDSILATNTQSKEVLASANIAPLPQTDSQEGDAQKILRDFSKQTTLPIFEHANTNSQDGQQQSSAQHTAKQIQSQPTQFTPTQTSEAANFTLNSTSEVPQISLDARTIEIASTTSSSTVAAKPFASVPATVSHMAVQQVGEAIVRQSEKSGDIVIRLDPAELGKVNITFTFDKAGGVNAHVVADTASTAAILRDRADILSTQLKQSGFENINLSFDTNSNEQSNKGFGTQFSNNAQSEHNANRTKFFDIVEQDARNPLLQAEKIQHRTPQKDGALDLKL